MWEGEAPAEPFFTVSKERLSGSFALPIGTGGGLSAAPRNPLASSKERRADERQGSSRFQLRPFA